MSNFKHSGSYVNFSELRVNKNQERLATLSEEERRAEIVKSFAKAKGVWNSVVDPVEWTRELRGHTVWRDAKTNPPPVGDSVLIIEQDDNGEQLSMIIGYTRLIDESVVWYRDTHLLDDAPINNVTHWLPLPNYPEKLL